jgi:hypothetical protein
MSAASPGLREVNVVAVCYQCPADRFVASLQRIAQRHGVALRGVLVCNRAQELPAGLHELGFDAAAGSNALLDFSGFFEGLERLLATRPEAAAGNVLFVNDTLFTKHAAPCILGRVLRHDALLRQLKLPAIAGKLDPYRSICRQNPWSGDRGFVTTFCYLVPRGPRRRLRRRRRGRRGVGAKDAGGFARAYPRPSCLRRFTLPVAARWIYAGRSSAQEGGVRLSRVAPVRSHRARGSLGTDQLRAPRQHRHLRS